MGGTFYFALQIFFALLRFLVSLILFIAFSRKFNKIFKKSISSSFVCRLLSLLIADAIAVVSIIVINTIINFIDGWGFILPSFSFYSIPLFRHFISIKDIIENAKQIFYSLRELLYVFEDYIGYSKLEFGIYYIYLCFVNLINIVGSLFFIIYSIIFLTRKNKVDDATEQETVVNNETPEQVHVTQTAPKPNTIYRKVNVNDTYVIEELKKYKTLLDSGVLTQEEFKAKKQQLLKL